MSAIPLSYYAESGQWRTDFLAVLPAVQTHARICFRKLRRCDSEEAVAETVASAFRSYGSLAQRGKLDRVHPSTLAAYAVHTVRNDRHVGGCQSATDVLSPLAQRRRGLHVGSLTPRRDDDGGWHEMTLEDRRVSPADQAAFNLDFAAWLKSFTRRDRRIISRLAAGERTSAVAENFALSEGRVSQLRRKFEQSWNQFQGTYESVP
jgi:hypothetical protein